MEAPPKETKISMENLAGNGKQVDFVIAIMFIVAGVVAGILGLQGLQGFILFLLAGAVVMIGLLTKCQFDIPRFITATTTSLLIKALSGQALSFVLFWTLVYALVHIY